MNELNEPHRMVIYDKWDRPLVEMKIGNRESAVEIKTEYEYPSITDNAFRLVVPEDNRHRLIVNVSSKWSTETDDGIIGTMRTYERIPEIQNVIDTNYVPDEIKRYLIGGS